MPCQYSESNLSTAKDMKTIIEHTKATTHVGVYSNVAPPAMIDLVSPARMWCDRGCRYC